MSSSYVSYLKSLFVKLKSFIFCICFVFLRWVSLEVQTGNRDCKCKWQELKQGLCGYCFLTTRPPGHFIEMTQVLSEVEFVVMDPSRTQFFYVRADVFRLVLNHQNQLVRSRQADQWGGCCQETVCSAGFVSVRKHKNTLKVWSCGAEIEMCHLWYFLSSVVTDWNI